MEHQHMVGAVNSSDAANPAECGPGFLHRRPSSKGRTWVTARRLEVSRGSGAQRSSVSISRGSVSCSISRNSVSRSSYHTNKLSILGKLASRPKGLVARLPPLTGIVSEGNEPSLQANARVVERTQVKKHSVSLEGSTLLQSVANAATAAASTATAAASTATAAAASTATAAATSAASSVARALRQTHTQGCTNELLDGPSRVLATLPPSQAL